jgi:uncharacterized protein YoxC
MPILGLCMLIIGILFLIYSVYSLKNTKKINDSIIKENKQIEDENNKLKEQQEKLKLDHSSLLFDINILNNNIKQKKEQLEDIQSTITSSTKAKEELSQKAFENYCEILEKQYQEAEDEYASYKDAMETAYSNKQLELLQQIEEVQQELTQIESTRAAAIQAQLKEKEIEENLSFYCLQVTDPELRDIAVLESIKPKLNQPRVLSMLIWQTFFRTPMTNLCNNVIGKTDKTGIYKITNLKTKECYIGQAANLSDRWKQHAKCGLGIDTPAGNKLYKAMQEFGIQNFSWEVLEECSRAELDEKEKYYIKLYQSKEFGYNSTKGNS